MALNINIHTPNGLVPISPKLTYQLVVDVLGYTPVDVSNYVTYDSISEVDDSAFYIVDSQLHILAQIDEDGLKAAIMTVNGKDVESGLIYDIKELADDAFYIVDSQSNVIAKIGENGLETTNVIALSIITNSIESSDSELYVVDTNNKPILSVGANGLETTNITAIDAMLSLHSVVDHIEDYEIHITEEERQSWNSKSKFDNISEDDNTALYINDKNNKTIAKFDANGLTVTNVSTNDVTVGSNKSVLSHINNTTTHITSSERTTWNTVTSKASKTELNAHINDTDKHIGDELKLDDDSALYINDKDNNTIVKVNSEGLIAAEVILESDKELHSLSEHVTNTDIHLGDEITVDDDTTLYINDKNNNTIVRVDEDGLTASNLFIYDKEVATKDYVNEKVTGLFEFKGSISSNADVPAVHEVGDAYRINKVGEYAGNTCEVGDMLVCIANGSTANNADWTVMQLNWTATDGSSTLKWGEAVTLATIGGVNIDAKLPDIAGVTSKIATGNNGVTSNTPTEVVNPYINHVEGSVVNSSVQFKGANTATVKATNGVITIDSGVTSTEKSKWNEVVNKVDTSLFNKDQSVQNTSIATLFTSKLDISIYNADKVVLDKTISDISIAIDTKANQTDFEEHINDTGLHIGDEISLVDNTTLYINDKDGKTIVRVDNNGLTAANISTNVIVVNGESVVALIDNKVDTSVFNVHTADTIVHITDADRTKWNAVVNKVDTSLFNVHINNASLHINNSSIHITDAERTKWNAVVNKVDTSLFNKEQSVQNTSITTLFTSKVDTSVFNVHVNNASIHITDSERTKWNEVVNKVDTSVFNTHTTDTNIHITDSERTKWNIVVNKVDTSVFNKEQTAQNTSINELFTRKLDISVYNADKTVLNKTISDISTAIGTKANQTDFEEHISDTDLHIGDEISLDDNSTLYISDKDGAIIAKFTESGFDAKVIRQDDNVVASKVIVDALADVPYIAEDGTLHLTAGVVDTNTTYTFKGGTNKFTVTPSEGSPYDVNVTPSMTVDASATDDGVVILAGKSGTNGVSYDAKHSQKGPAAGYSSKNTTTDVSGYGVSKTIKIPQITVDKYGHVTAAADEEIVITMPNELSLDNYKTKQNKVTDPTVSGSTTTTFISSISLNENGEITATKATIDVSNKVDKVEGKGLSENDYTTTEKNKLAGIVEGAEKNVQSDWSVIDSSSDAFIKNKPTKLSDFINDNNFITEVSWGGVTGKPTFASVATSGLYADLSNTPAYLPNQYSLKFGNKSYNGSSEQTITAEDLGLSQALKYHGISLTPLADGSTVNPITILGESHTAESGCVVFYNNKEFVWNGSAWEELGDLSGVDFTGYATEKWVEDKKYLTVETDPIFSASPAKGITDDDIKNWNSKTNNVGTITGITMNGVSKGTSGIVDLGTVITDVSNKVDKVAGKGLSKNDFTDALKEKLEELSNYNDASIKESIKSKLDKITDLDTIRTGASLGATALQEETYKGTVTSVTAGTGLTGGIITGSGTIAVDTENYKLPTYAEWAAVTGVTGGVVGTVSKVDLTMPDAFDVSGGPITTLGTFKVTLKSDKYIPSKDDKDKWDAAEKNVQSDWNVIDTSSDAFIKNKPTKLSDFTNDTGFIADISWGGVTGKPTFAAVATSGSYNDLVNKPTIPTGFAITANANDDNVVDVSVSGGTNSITIDAKHVKKGPKEIYTSNNTTTSISSGTTTFTIPQITVDTYGHVTAAADASVTITIPTAINGDKGDSVTAATAGASSDSNGYTITPVTFTVGDTTLPAVDVKAKHGYTPVKGVDYFDGNDGKSISSVTIKSGDSTSGSTDIYSVKVGTTEVGTFNVYQGKDFKYEDFTAEQLAALMGPKGDPGLTIKGTIEPSSLAYALFPLNAKINDAYVVSRDALSGEWPENAKKGDLWVCVKASEWVCDGEKCMNTQPEFNFSGVNLCGPAGKDGTSVTIKGSKNNENELPKEGNTNGDGYIVNGHLFVWDGKDWKDAGEIKGPQGEPGPKGDTGPQGEPGNGFYVMSEEDIEILINALDSNYVIYKGQHVNRDNLVDILLSETDGNNAGQLTHELSFGLYAYFGGSNYNFYLIDGYLFGNIVCEFEDKPVPYVASYEIYKIKGDDGKGADPNHTHSYTKTIDTSIASLSATSVSSVFAGVPDNTGITSATSKVSKAAHTHNVSAHENTYNASVASINHTHTTAISTDNANVASSEHTHSVEYTKVTGASFTGTSATTSNNGPSVLYNKGVLTISFSHNHSVTATGNVSILTDNATITTGVILPKDVINVPTASHTHDVNTTTTTPTIVSLAAHTHNAQASDASISVAAGLHSHSYTPSGTVDVTVTIPDHKHDLIYADVLTSTTNN